MKAKPYKINGNWDAGSSVVKVFYGDKKYVVIKGKNQVQFLKALENTLAAFIRGNEPNPDGMYYHLLLHIKKTPGNDFRVETVLQSQSGYELLRAEQSLLDAGRRDKNCLNNNVDAYIPQYNPDTRAYGWITAGDVLNFKNWRQKHPAPRKPRKAAE